MEKTLKLKETRMGEYQIEPVLSLTFLLESPYHYGRPSKMKRPSPISPKNVFNDAFVQATIPLEDDNENRAIVSWLYKEEVPADLTIQSPEITFEKYGQVLKLMKCLGYKGNGPIGYNNKGLIDPIKAISRWPRDTSGLGIKKIPCRNF